MKIPMEPWEAINCCFKVCCNLCVFDYFLPYSNCDADAAYGGNLTPRSELFCLDVFSNEMFVH